jgi:hypothetical protein
MAGSHLCIPRNETVTSEKQNYNVLFPVPTLIYLWEIYIFQDWFAYMAAGKYVVRSWDYINHSQPHECGNWDWGRAIPRKGIHKWDFPCSVSLLCIYFFFTCFLLAFLLEHGEHVYGQGKHDRWVLLRWDGIQRLKKQSPYQINMSYFSS